MIDNQLLKNAYIEIQSRRNQMKGDFDSAFPFPLIDSNVAKMIFWHLCKKHAFENAPRYPNGYLVSPRLKEILPNIVKWLIYDTEGDYDITRGLFLFGTTGSGKSELVRIAQKFVNLLDIKERQFCFVKVPEVYSYVEIDNGKMRDETYHRKLNACYDDMFYRKGKKIFGNDLSEIVEPELIRVRNDVSVKGRFTIFTANENPDMVGTILDGDNPEGRNFSRLLEMSNFIGFNQVGDEKNYRIA